MFVGGVEMSKRPSLKVVIACDCARAGNGRAGELHGGVIGPLEITMLV